MFRLFPKKSRDCPIDPDMRLWMEQAFLWLTRQFREIATRPMLCPTPECFPIRYDGSKESLLKTGEIIARQMDIDIKTVNLELYDEHIRQLSNGFGHGVWTAVDKDDGGTLTSGLYFDKNKKGIYDILIEKGNLNNPENLVATIAHEFSHIKILGEKRLDFNDEQLTDLTTVIFGLGIFSANAAFMEFKSFNQYGHSSLGYLKQREWGYALALYAYFRKDSVSDWVKYLTLNIRSDFKKSMDFINANKDRIFMEPYIKK